MAADNVKLRKIQDSWYVRVTDYFKPLFGDDILHAAWAEVGTYADFTQTQARECAKRYLENLAMNARNRKALDLESEHIRLVFLNGQVVSIFASEACSFSNVFN